MYALILELKLNNKERSLLKGCSGFRRLVYNYGLSLVKGSWSEDTKGSDSKRIGLAKKILTNSVMAQPEYSWMKNYPSTVYQSALQDLQTAFSRWRSGISNMPTLKAKKHGDSFTVYKTAGVYPQKGKPMLPFTNRQVNHPGKKIVLPGLGTFRLKEAIPYICSSQSFTITMQADKWYVSFTIDAERVPPITHSVEAVGIDLGVKTFATLSDGTTYNAPKPMRKAKTKLARLQWLNRNKQLGCSQKGLRASSRAKKFYDRQAKLHARVANQREDYLQKVTTQISKKYYRIRIEDLNVSGMVANHKLAGAISDLGFYEFRRLLVYKQAHYGTKVELVDRWYPSSKLCSQCGAINQNLTLKDRTFECSCGLVPIDRDLQAAINLLTATVARVVG